MTFLLLVLALVAATSAVTFVVATMTGDSDRVGERLLLVWAAAMVLGAALLIGSGPEPCNDPDNTACAAPYVDGAP